MAKYMVKKTLKGYFKSYNKDTDLIEFIASTGNEDLEGEVIDSKGWDLSNVGKNLPLLWSHDARELPIGKVVEARIDDNSLITTVSFANKINDFAKKVYELVKAGFLNAVSVGFIPTAYDAEGNMINQKLLELSVVNVPANEEALRSEMYQAFCKSLKSCETDLGDFEKMEIVDTKPFPNEHSCRLKDPAQFDTCRRGKRSHDGKQYSIIFCKKKGGKMEEQAYRYSKDTWTASEARTHCKDHKGSFEAAASESQQEDIEKKEGRVISEKTRNSIRIAIDALKQAGTALSDLLNITEPPAKKGGVKIKEQPDNNRDKRIIKAARTVDKIAEAIIHELKKGGENK